MPKGFLGYSISGKKPGSRRKDKATSELVNESAVCIVSEQSRINEDVLVG